jgi:hypothetical protein
MRMKLWFLLIFAFGLLMAFPVCFGQDKSAKWQTRQQFARAMAKIKEGMSQAQVRRIIGGPDDVRTRNDPAGIDTDQTKAIWCYGTNGHLTTPTLGQVYIDDADKVQYVYGGQSQPPTPSLFHEADLRRILRILDQVPSYSSGATCNPRLVIQAVNTLQPLGKGKALAAIQEYLRITPDILAYGLDAHGRGGMFLVLRSLFDVPPDPGYMPPMQVGAPSPDAPKDRRRMPRFPVVVQDDIPFQVVGGYTLGGVPEPPESALQEFRDNGRMRDKPLAPSPHPIAALETLLKTYADCGLSREMLASQLLYLTDSVYPLERDESSGYVGKLTDASHEQRDAALKAVDRLPIRWDAARNEYIFLNGSTKPSLDRQYHPENWDPRQPGLAMTVTVQRFNSHRISLYCHWQRSRPEQRFPPGVIQMFRAGDRTHPLTQFDFDDIGISTLIREMALTKGQQVVVMYTSGRTTLYSPVYTP